MPNATYKDILIDAASRQPARLVDGSLSSDYNASESLYEGDYVVYRAECVDETGAEMTFGSGATYYFSLSAGGDVVAESNSFNVGDWPDEDALTGRLSWRVDMSDARIAEAIGNAVTMSGRAELWARNNSPWQLVAMWRPTIINTTGPE